MESTWNYEVRQAESGWVVSGTSSQGSRLPDVPYPSAAKAIARLMQLMDCPGPVRAQEHAEKVWITREG
jgi:hypothetical protein